MGNEPLVYIILVNYNSVNHTLECIESLKKINNYNYKIIIVDNNSQDNSVIILEKYLDRIVLIKSSENLGFSGGNNLGIDYAIKNNADYVLLLNNDTIVEPSFLNNLLSEYDTNTGICTSKILFYYDKELIWYGGGEINKLKGMSDTVGSVKDTSIRENKTKYVTFASGCCMLISIKVIKKVGKLNEKYFLYFEDTDYCCNIIKQGYKIKYCPNSIVYHKESVSTIKKSFSYEYYFTRNRLFFIKNNINYPYKIIAYLYTINTRILRAIIRRYNLKPIFLGIKDFFLNKTGKLDEFNY